MFHVSITIMKHIMIYNFITALLVSTLHHGMCQFPIEMSQHPDYFIPFGPDEGDLVIEPNDDGSSGSIFLSVAFPYFDQLYDSIFVSTNGAISFEGPVSTYTPQAFPIEGFPLIAPYWTDVDGRRNDGRIYYR